MRIDTHPILDFNRGKKVNFYFEDRQIDAYEGETIAAALVAAGIKTLSYSKKHERPRGFFCAIGKCSSCLMNVDGKPNQMVCMIPVKEGMKVKRQIRGEK